MANSQSILDLLFLHIQGGFNEFINNTTFLSGVSSTTLNQSISHCNYSPKGIFVLKQHLTYVIV